MTPFEVIGLAESLLDRRDTGGAGLWGRAAALLGRQALEQGLDLYWRRRGLPLESLPMRPQLICLSEYLAGEGMAAKASHTWAALSRACHHHPYELPSVQAELRNWLTSVKEVLTSTESSASLRS